MFIIGIGFDSAPELKTTAHEQLSKLRENSCIGLWVSHHVTTSRALVLLDNEEDACALRLSLPEEFSFFTHREVEGSLIQSITRGVS